jgi:hypothetical protein
MPPKDLTSIFKPVHTQANPPMQARRNATDKIRYDAEFEDHRKWIIKKYIDEDWTVQQVITELKNKGLELSS